MAIYIDKPEPGDYAPYFSGYIDEAPDGSLFDVLRSQSDEMKQLLASISDERSLYRYAPGKWSIREVLGHMIDTERIFAYRALRIARNDPTPLPGFEQDDYVAAGAFDLQRWNDLVAACEHVRLATLDLFSSLSPEAWESKGTVSRATVSVQALAWIICGHQQHHVQILRTKYLA
jgi:hypothetical protein